MNAFQIFLIGIGLSMDAFAVSICKGLVLDKNDCKSSLIIATCFGFFQALMPYIGFILGLNFQNIFNGIGHWIAFGLLLIIGFNMLKDSFKNNTTTVQTNINISEMILLSIATSIDALAVGFSFALLQITIYKSIFIIGFTTFIISLIGVKIGKIFGYKFQNHAKLLGGFILILIGFSIILEHFIYS